MRKRRRRWDDGRIHSTWTPDESRRWTSTETARACARENTHRFGDEPAWQETGTDADVDGARQAVATSREIVHCRAGHRVLFVTPHGRPWGRPCARCVASRRGSSPMA